jgi:drug/metabolite transporter (DMT)-like permease
MTGNEKEIWFPAKRYGWGWGLPIAWQGWAVTIAYIIMLFGGVYIAKTNTTLSGAAFVLYFIGITVVLIGICWLKGEKPGWHWGS